MTEPLHVEWDLLAVDDLMRLPWRHAEMIDAAVQRFARGEERAVSLPEGFALFVDAYAVLFFVDEDTVHIARVRRSGLRVT